MSLPSQRGNAASLPLTSTPPNSHGGKPSQCSMACSGDPTPPVRTLRELPQPFAGFSLMQWRETKSAASDPDPASSKPRTGCTPSPGLGPGENVWIRRGELPRLASIRSPSGSRRGAIQATRFPRNRGPASGTWCTRQAAACAAFPRSRSVTTTTAVDPAAALVVTCFSAAGNSGKERAGRCSFSSGCSRPFWLAFETSWSESGHPCGSA